MFFTAFTGIGLMLGQGDTELNLIGILFAFLAASGATFTFITGSTVATKINPIVLTFWVNFMGKFMMPNSSVGLLLLCGATVCYILAILCQFQSLARLPAAKAAFVFNLEPVVSIVLTVAFLGEQLTTIQWIGAGIVMIVLLGFNGVIGQRRQP